MSFQTSSKHLRRCRPLATAGHGDIICLEPDRCVPTTVGTNFWTSAFQALQDLRLAFQDREVSPCPLLDQRSVRLADRLSDYLLLSRGLRFSLRATPGPG